MRDFLKTVILNNAIVDTLDWSCTKREISKELVERMSNRLDFYQNDLFDLIFALVEFKEFPHLKFWDEDGSKTNKAKQAVKNLAEITKGYQKLVEDSDVSKKRKLELEKKIAKSKTLEDELNELKRVFSEIAQNTNFQQRGYQLEKFLNELFLLYDLDPKGSFKNYGEQIDGAFTFDSTDYLLEAKWKQEVGRGDFADFCYKVETKLKNAMGLFVTIDGVTKEAILPAFKSILIMDGVDIIAIIEGRVSLPDLLYRKRRKANQTGKIYVNFNNL
ncbi:MAG: hypothetical protein ABIP95_07070 [Pelobium sp.]